MDIHKIEEKFSGIIVIKNLASGFPSVPRFVSEYLIMSVMQEDGTILEEDLREIAIFINNNRPDPKEYEVWKDKFRDLTENSLIDIFNVQVDLTSVPPLRKCKVPFLKKESPIQIRDEIVEKYQNLLREGMWGLGKIKQTSQK